MMTRLSTPGLATVLIAAACGGNDPLDPFDPGSGDTQGTGSSTLLVQGSAEAYPRFANAQTSDDFDTHIEVRVSKAGVDIVTGEVAVTSSTGTTALTYDANDGRWRGSKSGYEEVYQIDITSGTDFLQGAKVDGPDLHFFTAPLAGATVDSTMPLVITWDCEDHAESAVISSRETDWISITDSWTYTLPANTLRNKPDAVEDEEITLRRESTISPGGTSGGSEWQVRIENQIDLLVAPAP
jgi:hypothetical protein